MSRYAPLPRIAVASALAAGLTVAGASPASAAYMYIRSTHTSANYVYGGDAGENNKLTVKQVTLAGRAYYDFSDANAGIVGIDERCSHVTPSEVICPIVDDQGFA